MIEHTHTRNVHNLRDVLCLGCGSCGEPAGDPAAAAAFRREAIHRASDARASAFSRRRAGCENPAHGRFKKPMAFYVPRSDNPRRPARFPRLGGHTLWVLVRPPRVVEIRMLLPSPSPTSPLVCITFMRPVCKDVCVCVYIQTSAARSGHPTLEARVTAWQGRTPWCQGNSRFCVCNPFHRRKRNQYARTGAPQNILCIATAWTRFRK